MKDAATQLLQQLTEAHAVPAHEEEVREILNDRTKEEAASELEISVYDTMRNEKAKKHRQELVRTIWVIPKNCKS